MQPSLLAAQSGPVPAPAGRSGPVSAWADTELSLSPWRLPPPTWLAPVGCRWLATRVERRTAFALFPKDLAMAPRAGHFAALDQPALLAEDIATFLDGRS